MRIGWIVNEQWLEETPTGLYSSMASYRHRAIIPGLELTRRGFETSVIGLLAGAESQARARRYLKDLDIVVFGKLFDATSAVPPLLRAAREAGVRTVVDVCDDYFEKPFYGENYRDIVAAADAVFASSAFLAARIAETTGRRALVIADPYEGARGTPRWQPREKLEAVWFGNIANLAGLHLAFDGLVASRIPMRVVVMTNLEPVVLDWAQRCAPALAPAIDLDMRQWSLQATARALRECDLVLLPIDRSQEYYLAKGPDRMVEALWAGRLVVSHPLPAYEEFRDWAWIGKDIAEGLAWALANPAAVTARVAQAQAHIAARYSPATIAGSWGAYLTKLREGRLPAG